MNLNENWARYWPELNGEPGAMNVEEGVTSHRECRCGREDWQKAITWRDEGVCIAGQCKRCKRYYDSLTDWCRFCDASFWGSRVVLPQPPFDVFGTPYRCSGCAAKKFVLKNEKE